MSAEPVHHHPAPAPAALPRRVRENLLPEEVGSFDSEWRAAMVRAAESLDLSEVYGVLERWRNVAEMTRADPAAHRRMLERVARLRAGGAGGTVTADDQRAMISRRLGTPSD